MQTTTKPTTRSRMTLSRARTGCRTCKARRVKCDEKKPVCQRCIRVKRHCAGYEDATTLNKKPQTFNITYYVPNALSPWTTGISEDVEQEHALDCFYFWTTKCFPSGLMVPFWQQDILHEPATRHAMMAMGILHEIYRHNITGPPSIQRRINAMQHYGKSIRSLLSQHCNATSNKMTVSLLACLLFVSLEMTQGHYKSALAHLQSGFNLFRGVVVDEQQTLQNDFHASERILRSLFVRMMCQITHFDLADCARFLGLLDGSSESAIYFASLNQAREQFVALLSRILSRRQIWATHGQTEEHDSRDNLDPRDKALTEELLEIDQWILAFNLYLSHNVPTSQTCDLYTLSICAFFLKFRLTMESRDCIPTSAETMEMNLAHIASLGDILFEVSQRSKDPTSACPLHRLFGSNQGMSHDHAYSSEQSLFPFLGVFCSLFVSSIYSPNAAIRLKAHDTVSRICCCGKGWDQSLTVYIASLICSVNKDGQEFAPSLSEDLFPGQLLSMETRSLLALLRLLNSF